MKRFATICSGIGAPEQAAKGLDWKPVFNAEIEPFPRAVLKHHYPETPNYGDITKYENWPTERLDLLAAGTPCQTFSVAGLRKGLADPRGNLTLTFLAIVARHRPTWVLWENVPGVLSDKTGAFGAFLGGLGQLGYGFAYRILDAQYFGVAQRRRRVFVVGHIGGLWQRAAAVLFERESLCGNPPPRREPRERPAPTISARTKGGGGLGTDFDCDGGLVTPSLVSNGDAHSGFRDENGVVPVGIDGGEVGYALRSTASHSGDKGDGGVNTTMVVGNDARAVMMRGREGCAGGGKGPLLSEEKSLTLAANANDQVLFVPRVSPCVKSNKGQNSDPAMEAQSLVAHYLRAEYDASEDGTGRGTPIVPESVGALTAKGPTAKGPTANGAPEVDAQHYIPETAPCRTARDGKGERMDVEEPSLVTFGIPGNRIGRKPENGGNAVEPMHEVAPNLAGADRHGVAKGMAVRRLTPRECERLQGFPDNFTFIEHNGKPAKDGPRYKALGNSMAVPVIRWILNRIDAIDEMKRK